MILDRKLKFIQTLSASGEYPHPVSVSTFMDGFGSRSIQIDTHFQPDQVSTSLINFTLFFSTIISFSLLIKLFHPILSLQIICTLHFIFLCAIFQVWIPWQNFLPFYDETKENYSSWKNPNWNLYKYIFYFLLNGFQAIIAVSAAMAWW